MPAQNDLVRFEDGRWRSEDQEVVFRHTATLDLINPGTVLDLGCGDGLFLSLLKERGISGEGIDASSEGVRKCAEKGLTAHVHSLTDPLPYPDASFDTVVLLDVLEHAYDPLLILREARRVSKRDVIISVPNFSSLPARLQVLAGMVPENNRPGKGHVYWFNYSILRRLATKAGLQVAAMRTNTFFPFSLAGNAFPCIAPSLFALSFVAKFEKEV